MKLLTSGNFWFSVLPSSHTVFVRLWLIVIIHFGHFFICLSDPFWELAFLFDHLSYVSQDVQLKNVTYFIWINIWSRIYPSSFQQLQPKFHWRSSKWNSKTSNVNWLKLRNTLLLLEKNLLYVAQFDSNILMRTYFAFTFLPCSLETRYIKVKSHKLQRRVGSLSF